MSKEEQEAEMIVEKFGKYATTHVEGIMYEINEMDCEFFSRIASERIEYWQEVLAILKNK
jgi:hypothetical protein